MLTYLCKSTIFSESHTTVSTKIYQQSDKITLYGYYIFVFPVFFVPSRQNQGAAVPNQHTTQMKFKEGYKVREIAGEHVVIMQGRFGSDMTRVIALNDSSLLLWNELQGKEFDAALAARILVENYEVDEATALRDAEAWVEKLVECKLV